jgi:hypothetical protein
VVDILIEEGALEDPVDDLTLAQIEETCAAEDAERAASSRPPSEGPSWMKFSTIRGNPTIQVRARSSPRRSTVSTA